MHFPHVKPNGKRLLGWLVLVSALLVSGAASAQSNLVAYYSSSGDYIGQGGTYYTLNEAEFGVSGSADRFVVSAFGYSAYFDGPGATALQVGVYTNATRWPFNDDTPGLSVSGNGRGCNQLCGDFEIRELGLTDAGDVNRLWVTFTQHCECFMAPLSGEIRYHSQLAPDTPPPRTWRVPADFATIQQAIDRAALGDTVLVAPGTYLENINFQGKEIIVRSELGPELTIIDGRNQDSVVKIIGHVTRKTLFQGFTVRNGRASFNGGGIAISGGAPSILGNVIRNNNACSGGGIDVEFASPLIQDNVIADNRTTTCSPGSGGGIYLGGAAAAEVIHNVVRNNSSGRSGGIELFAAGTPLIKDNFVAWNHGGADAGGISMVNYSDALIVGNVIVWNVGGSVGGISCGVPSGDRGPYIINNTIAYNEGATASGIVSDGFDQNTLIANNIIVGIRDQPALVIGSFNDPFQPIMRNNDLFANPPFGGLGSTPVGNNGNFSGDPLFLDAPAGDFHLSSHSPAVDAASAQDAPADDFDGVTRPIDGDSDGASIADLGAFEYRPQPPSAPRNLTASSIGLQVSLSWRANPDATSYRIERSLTSGGPYNGVGTVAETNFVDTTVASNVVYYYVVSGINVFGEGANSTEVSVKAGNVPPRTRDDLVTILEDTPADIDILANDLDPNGDALLLAGFTQPSHGVVTPVAPRLHYVPALNFNGSDTFSYVVTDGRGAFATGQVQVVITSVNDPPTAVNSTVVVASDSPGTALAAQGTDPDGDPLQVQIISPPLHGVINPSTMIYRPVHGFVGNDALTFKLSDPKTNSNMATLTIEVRPALDADRDGIPDYWEALYDINNTSDDRDRDGHSNYQEYLANTDPRDPESVLRMLSIQPTQDNHWVIAWRSAGGTRYRVQYSDARPDGSFTGAFTDVVQPLELETDAHADGAPGLMSFTDSQLPPAPRARFFRIKVVNR